MDKYAIWFKAALISGISGSLLIVFIFSSVLVNTRDDQGQTYNSYKTDLAPPASSTPTPVGPNGCLDYDGEAFSADFDIQKAQLKRKKNGTILLRLEATFVDTSRGARSSSAPVPLANAQGGWVKLTLQSNLEQESFLFIIANGRITIPDWTSQEFKVEFSETKLGADVLFSGSGITRKTSGPFEWALSTKDGSNSWDVCPDQESAFLLERLLPYRP